MEQLAVTDELTGLKNRRGFLEAAEERVEVAIEKSKGLTVLFLDLNGLKQINDNLGHQEGDAAICDAAAILRSTFREDDVIGRLGGDEFCVLLTDDKQQTDSPITRLEAMADIHNMQSGRPFKVSMSVGTALFDPDNPRPIEDLIEEADKSMYEQKMNGSKRYRLLVGDDDPSICALAEAMFSDEYEVITAFTGKQVIDATVSERPDLVLLDLHLPDMLGTEVVQLMRQNPKTKLTPVIMITGDADQTSELDSLRSGVDDYVEKPFDEDKLRARMEIALKRKLRR
jgi:diguanylate cyclase (GGDEF)-like protein